MITSACFPAWGGAHKYFILSIQWCQWNQSSFTSGCIVKVELIKTFFFLLLLLFCKTSQSRSLLVIVWIGSTRYLSFLRDNVIIIISLFQDKFCLYVEERYNTVYHKDDHIDMKNIADDIIDTLIQTPFFHEPGNTL